MRNCPLFKKDSRTYTFIKHFRGPLLVTQKFVNNTPPLSLLCIRAFTVLNFQIIKLFFTFLFYNFRYFPWGHLFFLNTPLLLLFFFFVGGSSIFSSVHPYPDRFL